jgi:hypothetical protein
MAIDAKCSPEAEARMKFNPGAVNKNGGYDFEIYVQ